MYDDQFLLSFFSEKFLELFRDGHSHPKQAMIMIQK